MAGASGEGLRHRPAGAAREEAGRRLCSAAGRRARADEPRSVSEAIAVATLQAEGVTELKAELEASRAREQELRASLAAQKDAVEIEQQTVQRTEQLDERMAQLASAEASVAARERAAAEQLAEAEALREAI